MKKRAAASSTNGQTAKESDAILKTGHVCVGIVDTKGAQKASESALVECIAFGRIAGLQSSRNSSLTS